MGEYLDKLTRICRQMDELDKQPKKGGIELETVKPNEKLYNIYKRSIPVGIDKLVILNVPYEDALKVCAVLNKIQLKKRTKENSDEFRTHYYFDMVASDASFEEKSIYWNPKEFVKEEGSDPEVEILKGYDNWIN